MGQLATMGLDTAKSVFQVHGVDAEDGVVIRPKLTRARLLKFFENLSPCLVGIEACGTVGPRTDWSGPQRAADAAQLCEAVGEAPEDRHGRRGGDLRGGGAEERPL